MLDGGYQVRSFENMIGNGTISYNLWLEKHKYRPVMYQTYLSGTGSQIAGGYVPSTTVVLAIDDEKLETIKCDFVFVFEKNGIKHPYIGELIREKYDRAVKQLEKHVKALAQQLYMTKYDRETVPYVLAVFDNEELMTRVFDYMSANQIFDNPKYSWYKRKFLFATGNVQGSVSFP